MSVQLIPEMLYRPALNNASLVQPASWNWRNEHVIEHRLTIGNYFAMHVDNVGLFKHQLVRFSCLVAYHGLYLRAVCAVTSHNYNGSIACYRCNRICRRWALFSPGVFWPGGAFVRGSFARGDFCPGGLCPFPPQFQYVYEPSRFSVPSMIYVYPAGGRIQLT